MKCPKCGHELEKRDFSTTTIPDNRKGIYLICPRCGYFRQDEIDDNNYESISCEAMIKYIESLITLIESKKDDEDDCLTYKEAPILKKLAQIAYRKDNNIENDLLVSNEILRYLSVNYSNMSRVGQSIKYDKTILDNDLLLLKINKDKDLLKLTKQDIIIAVRNRNVYQNDDCFDLIDKFKGFYSEVELKNTITNAPNHKTSDFEYDLVELSDEYLNVIDEVEEALDNMTLPKSLGACHYYWAAKRNELAKHGIDWNSPAQLNMNIMFD